MYLSISTFDPRDNLDALKVLEEAGELQVAINKLKKHEYGKDFSKYETMRNQAMEELGDVVTACANLSEKWGFDLQKCVDMVEEKNRLRKRYV